MDLEQLNSFLTVARLHSFTEAAKELRLSQPGLSRQVQRLEQEVGAPLFVRKRMGVTLTAPGERLHSFAQTVLGEHRRLLDDLDQPAEVTGDLRIAASTTPGEFVVPSLLARFTEHYPNVRPRVFIADSAVVAEELAEGVWDLGFMGIEVPGNRLRYEPITEDEVVLAVPSGHPFAHRGTISPAQLEGQHFIEREEGSGTLRTVREVLSGHAVSLPAFNVVMVLSTTHAIVSAVEQGYGIGWVSTMALEGRPPSRVQAVRLDGIPIRRQLYLVESERYPPVGPAAAFAAWIRRTVGESRGAAGP